MDNLSFPIAAVILSLFISIIYFSKKRVNSYETKIYGTLLVTNLFEVVFAFFGLLVIKFIPNVWYTSILVKIDYIMILLWSYCLFKYVLHLSESNYHKITELIAIVYNIICIFLLLVLDVNITTSNGIINTYGLSTNILYFSCVVYIVLIIVYSIKIGINKRSLNRKKLIPLFILVICIAVMAVIKMCFPEIILQGFIFSFTSLVMYHTIENPDMRLIEQLNIARDQAERANNAKSEFLSNMSHEIRTPLNAIVGFSQALSEEENVPESAKDEIKDIMMASQNLLEIVNGILDISKIEANKLEIVNTEYSLKNVLEELTALTKSRIGEKPITLRTVFDPSIPPVLYGDYVRLKQIVLNLLTNAAKYTKEGYIEFKVDSVIKDDVCRLIISVEDTGIGIKKESIDKLFNKFERLDLEKNITIEGTGLGLAITKKLVELMNGNIVVQSEYGNGSKFTVAIDQRIVEGKEEIASEINTEIELFDATDKRILLVDDNKINLKVAVRLLQSYQIQIDQAMSGQECIDKIKEGNSYNLILLDDMMPKMSGVETLKELQKMEGFQVPTIAFTANAISGMKEKYLSAGFNDYLSKPIDKLELNHLLVKYLKEGEK